MQEVGEELNLLVAQCIPEHLGSQIQLLLPPCQMSSVKKPIYGQTDPLLLLKYWNEVLHDTDIISVDSTLSLVLASILHFVCDIQ